MSAVPFLDLQGQGWHCPISDCEVPFVILRGTMHTGVHNFYKTLVETIITHPTIILVKLWDIKPQMEPRYNKSCGRPVTEYFLSKYCGNSLASCSSCKKSRYQALNSTRISTGNISYVDVKNIFIGKVPYVAIGKGYT
ncbi:hypothetical protein Lal_00016227 [Lupinus albus]|nr:hypothetical protein Lal_00016227 [Lupinus albus]